MIEPVRLKPEDHLPILGVKVADLPSRIMVVGDPARAEKAAARLDSTRELGRTREYVTLAGSHRGTEVAVVSHGVGGPGAAVCFEELCRAGAERIIRAGSAGGLQPEVLDGHLVVATAAIRHDGYSPSVVPTEFPAVADHHLVAELVAAGEHSGHTLHRGIVLTSGVFYPHAVLGSPLAFWQQAGAVAVEMEVAALFVVASLHRVPAAAILAIDGNPLLEDDEEMSGYNPNREVVHRAIEAMIDCALAVLVI